MKKKEEGGGVHGRFGEVIVVDCEIADLVVWALRV
jgi:hypothetical protein